MTRIRRNSGSTSCAVPGSDAGSFLGLNDTPNSYSGQSGKAVIVKTDESGLEFGTVSSGSGSGNVTGPASSVTDNFASFLDTTGKILKDSGYGAASFLKQGSNTLTQDLNFDGAFNVGFGKIIPIQNFNVISVAGSECAMLSGNDVISILSNAGNPVLGTSQMGSHGNAYLFFNDSTDTERVRVGARYVSAGVSEFYVDTSPSATTTNIKVTQAGVIKFLPTGGAPTIGYVPTATNADGSWTWQAAGGSSQPFSDATALMKDNVDATKLWALQLSSITTGTTRTWTVPDFDGTFARSSGTNTFTGVQTFSAAPVFSAAFTIPDGSVATTQSAGDNTAKPATTAFVTAAISAASLPSFDTTHDGYVLQSGSATKLLLGDGTWATNLPTGTTITAPSVLDNSTKIINSAYVDGATGKLDKLIVANRQTASYTLVLADGTSSKVVEMNVGTTNNLTVPPNSSVAFPTGTQIVIAQYGAGQTTILAGSGVTLRSDTAKLKINAQYGACTIVKIGTDEWYVWGDLAA